MKNAIRETLNKILTEAGARPVCFGHLDSMTDAITEVVMDRQQTFVRHLLEMMGRGWAITLPAFEQTRAFGISAQRDEDTFGGSWTGSSDSLFEAIERLTHLTRDSD